uniref:Kinesin motor domain-containing protein n=1 Tax=Stegastes partitus TaxID=144197 RepID=A0A3B5A625_9TELE
MVLFSIGMQVKVVLRVSPTLSQGQGQPPVLWIDPSKKRVTIMEPVTKSQPFTTMTLGRDSKGLLKTFNFDAAYPQESSQVCLRTSLCSVHPSGSWSSMVGSSENIQKLGVIPCAISWLYSAIERRREKTWTDLTVSVSAIELCCGEEDTLRDLLGEVVPSSGGIQDSPKARIRLQDDPVYGIQLRNHNRVKAPTAERAASLLDAAIAARRHSDFVTYLSHSSIMFFTLHVQPPRTESSTIGKGCSRGPTKLTMIDVCSGLRGINKNKPPHAELGPIVIVTAGQLVLFLHRASKLTMLLRESLGHANCHTAVIAQVADSLANLQETFSTIQLASRIRRTQKRTKVLYTSSTDFFFFFKIYHLRMKGPQSFSLRAFHSTDEVDVDMRPFRLRGELDERSSSDQSCDTVIQIDCDGLVHSKAAPRQVQPEFVPIIPSLHPNKADLDDPEFTALLQEKQPERDCLKCDTFAELQERLGCIDGSEVMDILKSSSKAASLNNTPTKSQPQKETGKQADAGASEPPQTLLNQGSGCSQTSVGEKQTDGAFPGDTFQREDSGLYDCEECSATSSSEELLNQTLSRNKTGRSEPPKTGTCKSGDELSSQGFNTDAQGSSLAHQPSGKQESPEAAEWFKPDKRASPVGKSTPISPSSSCSSSNTLVKSVILGDVLHNRPKEDIKEMKATITVTVQQPLDLKGQDELVFSMVEEVTISGAYDRGRTGGNIICIRDAAQSQAQAEGSASSQPIRIISNVSEESAAASSTATKSSDIQPEATKASNEKPQHQYRREKGFLPSFINHMLIDMDVDCDLDGAKELESRHETELKRNNVKHPESRKVPEKKNGTHVEKSDKACYSSCSQISYNPTVLEDLSFCNKPAESKMCEKKHTDKRHHRDGEHVYSTSRVSEGGEVVCRHVGNPPRGVGVSPGCHETILASSKTGSLPRGWQNANRQDGYLGFHMLDDHRDSRGVTSSTPCSPGVTLERRQGRQHSPANHSLHIASPRKHGAEFKQDSSGALRKGVGSLFEISSQKMKHDNTAGNEESGRLFNAKLEQLVSRTNSLGRSPRDFPTLQRGSSNTSMSSKGSSKGIAQSGRHSKLSAVGKLKMAGPKVRRLSAPSIKNLSMSHKNLQQSINRSASLSPDSKSVSFERTQSSTCSSTKSAIQGFVNGRISDLLKERASSPTAAGGPDQTAALPSPYSQVTAPRMPDHMSGHASDTTSVLSGDLPPAMGKTSLYFSNRNSLVSSGYDSMVRDSEATGSSTSTRDSVSDRSGSLLSVARSSRSSRRRGNTGTQQRRLSHDAPPTLKRSTSGLRSRWMDRGIPEAYEIKVYEIDNVQRMQKRAGAGKQGPACFSAKLKFLEHRQQRISEVRAKYNNLRRELEEVKHDLMLEPDKWNQEFDLWQTFEVDSLEHLEALEVVTAGLENRVNLCKANVMMVTCFDATTRRRHKKLLRFIVYTDRPQR